MKGIFKMKKWVCILLLTLIPSIGLAANTDHRVIPVASSVNVSKAQDTDLLPSDFGPLASNSTSARLPTFIISIKPHTTSAVAQLQCSTWDDVTSTNVAFTANLNGGAALSAGSLYTFDLNLDYRDQSCNIQATTGGTQNWSVLIKKHYMAVRTSSIQGNTPANDSYLITKPFTGTSGEEVRVDVDLSLEPSGASTLTPIAIRGRITTGNVQLTSLDGHPIGMLASIHHNQATSIPLVIGAEGYIKNLQSGGTIIAAYGLTSHIAENVAGATITEATGLKVLVNANAGTIITTYGVDIQANGGGGTTGHFIGYGLGNLLEDDSGDITTITGYRFDNQTGNDATSIAIHNLDTNGFIISESTIEATSTTSASIQTDGGIGVVKNVHIGGTLNMSGTPQTLIDAGAVNLTSSTTNILTTTPSALTLAAGSEGQHKFLVMTLDTGDATLTPTAGTLWGGTTITFSAVGQTAHLVWSTGKWAWVGGSAALA